MQVSIFASIIIIVVNTSCNLLLWQSNKDIDKKNGIVYGSYLAS